MKKLVKIAKSLHADSETLNAMFAGYVVLLLVAGSVMMKGGTAITSVDGTVTALSKQEYKTNLKAQ